MLDILAKKKPAAMAHSGGGFKIHGDLIVNGVSIPASKGLYDRLAYVQQDIRWCPDMTVRQSLLFTALLQAPGRPARNFDTRGRVSSTVHNAGHLLHECFTFLHSQFASAQNQTNNYALFCFCHQQQIFC